MVSSSRDNLCSKVFKIEPIPFVNCALFDNLSCNKAKLDCS